MQDPESAYRQAILSLRERHASAARRATSERRHAPEALPSELWFVQLGVFLNYLGWGAVMPFEVIYLHEVRGFSLGIAGVVVGILTGLAVVAAPVSGPLIDRYGARTIAAIAGISLAIGYVGLAFAQSPEQAFLAAGAAGIGNGGLLPSQSALMAALAPPRLRHRVTATSRVASNLGAAAGATIGGAVAAHGLAGFVSLFIANAVTYLLYVAILIAAVRREVRPEQRPGGYRLLLSDRAFIHLALTNVAVLAVGWGIFTWIVPPFARSQVGASTSLVGLLLGANAVTVVVGQIPVARLSEGKRRVVTMATGSWIFAVACLLVVGSALVGTPYSYVLLFAAVIAVGLGECFHTTVLMPLTADLAPAALRGRYMAAMGLSWWLGLALAPSLGGQLLSASPVGTMLCAAAVAIGAAASIMRLDRNLPSGVKLTPRPTAC